MENLNNVLPAFKASLALTKATMTARLYVGFVQRLLTYARVDTMEDLAGMDVAGAIGALPPASRGPARSAWRAFQAWGVSEQLAVPDCEHSGQDLAGIPPAVCWAIWVLHKVAGIPADRVVALRWRHVYKTTVCDPMKLTTTYDLAACGPLRARHALAVLAGWSRSAGQDEHVLVAPRAPTGEPLGAHEVKPLESRGATLDPPEARDYAPHPDRPVGAPLTWRPLPTIGSELEVGSRPVDPVATRDDVKFSLEAVRARSKERLPDKLVRLEQWMRETGNTNPSEEELVAHGFVDLMGNPLAHRVLAVLAPHLVPGSSTPDPDGDEAIWNDTEVVAPVEPVDLWTVDT